MICKQCQRKVLRHCVSACGGLIPLNALGCENFGNQECEWEQFAEEIVEIFRTTENFLDKLKKDEK